MREAGFALAGAGAAEAGGRVQGVWAAVQAARLVQAAGQTGQAGDLAGASQAGHHAGPADTPLQEVQPRRAPCLALSILQLQFTAALSADLRTVTLQASIRAPDAGIDAV